MKDATAPHYLLVALAKFAQNDGGIHKVSQTTYSSFIFAIISAARQLASLEQILVPQQGRRRVPLDDRKFGKRFEERGLQESMRRADKEIR